MELAWNASEENSAEEIERLRNAAPEVKQEPVAEVDANDECYWADILPDRNVKVGQLLYAFPPDAQAEIAKRDARIESLTSAGAEYQRQCFEQAEEISRLKGVIAKCKDALEDSHQNINQERGFASDIKQDIEQTLAAIKEIENVRP